ncbi:4Fe-4S cluster-binding domain-containing protein, partial [Candidatus Bathyarchaeota archaeon]|nr:4Fe-4S cluster-binding domain-containing protein [Candidatus Bathyarchaeota archaeon]
MFFHLLLTTNCDLQCRYCYVKSCEDIEGDFGNFKVDYQVPIEVGYKMETLRKFIEKDPEPVLIFYGGEPMLSISKIKEIMDCVNADQFNIQTNGLHLDKLEPEYLNQLTTIFISIDGKRTLTDFYRGKGVYN